MNQRLRFHVFIVPGQAISQQPPRSVTKKGRTWTYRPNSTKDYIKRVAEVIRLRTKPLPKSSPVRLWILFYLKIGKKGSLTAKHDLDKLAGSILDSLTGRVYEDDSQVVELITRKEKGEPRTVIVVEELPHDEQIEMRNDDDA